jgi:Reverse transcriptase (RNA-dependent DNA polymerase).
MTGIQGCHINTKIVNACLKDAKANGKTCIVSFLDVSKAFDSIGHAHIFKSIEALGIPRN